MRQIVFKFKILAIYKTSLPNIAQFHNSWSPSTHARLTIPSLLSRAASFPPLQENLVEMRIFLIVAIVFTCNGNYCTAIGNSGQAIYLQNSLSFFTTSRKRSDNFRSLPKAPRWSSKLHFLENGDLAPRYMRLYAVERASYMASDFFLRSITAARLVSS